MLKKKYLIIMLICIMLTGCSNKNNVENKSSDVEIEKPEGIVVTENNSESNVSNDDREIVNGFWVEKCLSGNEEYYRYIPLMSSKIPGIYDFEDDEQNTKMDSYSAYNCPKGAKKVNLKSRGIYIGYFSNAQLGYNKKIENEKISENDLVKYTTSFSLVEDGNKNSMESYDVGCITMALYKDLYNDFPEINMKVYGIPKQYMEDSLGDVLKCNQTEYKSFIKKCYNNNFSECDLLAEKKIEDSSIFYLDYNSNSKNEKYSQYFIVLEFSKSSGYAYYMNGNLTYNITDTEKYLEWKNEHISQYILE